MHSRHSCGLISHYNHQSTFDLKTSNVLYKFWNTIQDAFWPISVAIILTLIVGRFIVGHEIGRFILLEESRIIEGEFLNQVGTYPYGYDGQFFYRYALDPFSVDKVYSEGRGNEGILVDSPEYRRARITYPLVSWMLAFGQPGLVPYSLVLTNFLSFLMLCLGFKRLTERFEAPKSYVLLSWFIFGIYFATARSLSDGLAATFLLWSYLFFLDKKYYAFLLITLFTLLCRETTALFLLPMYVASGLQDWRLGDRWKVFYEKVLLTLPWILFVGWKWYLLESSGDILSDLQTGGIKHFDLPFRGMVQGFSFDYLWLKAPYVIWTFIIGAFCISAMYSKRIRTNTVFINVWVGLILITLFSVSIYKDHWAFIRLYAPVQLFCYVFIIQQRIEIPRVLWLFGAVLLIQSIVFVVFLP